VISPYAAGFTAFGPAHVVALVVMVAVIPVVVAVGRRRRTSDPDDRLGTAFAVVLLLVTIPLQVVYFTPGYWDLDTTLPIQLCDLASLVSAYALWTHRWWAAGLIYYWGLTLTIQAILTPSLTSAPGNPVFWLYWGMHLGTVWAAVYLTWGRGLRPDWRSYRVAVTVTTCWAAAVYCFNLVADTNYGFLNRKPSTASILDLLGPWPWYVAAEVVIVWSVWALMTWPWVRALRRSAAG
jgi:hypothetical integral membrane protein (TIGR02206 family)